MTHNARRSGKLGFLGLSGNAAVCIALFPLWSIPYSFYFFYLSLYMRADGVSNSQLGSLMLIGSAASVVAAILSAPIVDRMGRKRSTLIFDLISSAAPCFIFAASGSFLFSFAGMILSNMNKIMSVGYYLLMTEDSSDDEKLRTFNIFNIILVAAGLLIPATGGLVEKYGVVKTERIFLLISGVSMTALAFIRNRLTKETTTGLAIMEKEKGRPLDFAGLIKPYIDSIKYLASHPVSLATALANILFYVYYIVGTNNSLYFTPFFGDALGLNARQTSIAGALYSAGMLAAMLIINPLARKRGVVSNATWGALLCASGAILFIAAPRNSAFVWAIAATAVSALGFGMLKSAVDAAIVIKSEGDTRAAVYATANCLSSLIGIGAGFLCGALYGRNPRSIYIISLVLLAAIPLCFAAASHAEKRASRRAQR